MANNWIKMRDDLQDDPAVMEMAERLGVREEVVVGYCHAFWSWVSRQMSLNLATGVTLVSLGRRLNLPGFPELLCEVGWLEYTESDPEHGGKPVIRIPHFDRHLSEGAKQRALKARQRAEQRKKSVAKNGDKCRQNAATKRRLEKRREENIYKDPPNPPRGAFDPLSLALPHGDSFREAWSLWVVHRKEIKKPLRKTSATQQLRRLGQMTESQAVATIEHTIERGWTGLREPEVAGNGKAELDPLRGL